MVRSVAHNETLKSMETANLEYAYTPHIPTCEGIPVTDNGGPWGCETSRIPHFLDNWLTDGGEIVKLTLQKNSWCSFILEAESTPTECGWKD
jgi:hypothetical protein